MTIENYETQNAKRNAKDKRKNVDPSTQVKADKCTPDSK
jgi:hypothetical protein